MARTGLSLALLAALTLPAVSANVAQAAGEPAYEMEYTNETPLIVIRFNQRHVAYEKVLYTTLTRALQVKPSATFDVISVAPRATDKAGQTRNDLLAAQNTQRVIATMRGMGMPASRINLTNAVDDVGASETRIFVH
jgi:hypothetical protein